MKWAKAFLLLAIPIYVVVIGQDFVGVESTVLDDGTLQILIIMLLVMGAITLAIGYFMPRLLIRFIKTESVNKAGLLFYVLLFRASLFESVAVYGLVLGILGVGLQNIWPFFLLSALALVITFPTEARVKKILSDLPEL